MSVLFRTLIFLEVALNVSITARLALLQLLAKFVMVQITIINNQALLALKIHVQIASME